jgi:hypothetical protein
MAKHALVFIQGMGEQKAGWHTSACQNGIRSSNSRRTVPIKRSWAAKPAKTFEGLPKNATDEEQWTVRQTMRCS